MVASLALVVAGCSGAGERCRVQPVGAPMNSASSVAGPGAALRTSSAGAASVSASPPVSATASIASPPSAAPVLPSPPSVAPASPSASALASGPPEPVVARCEGGDEGACAGIIEHLRRTERLADFAAKRLAIANDNCPFDDYIEAKKESTNVEQILDFIECRIVAQKLEETDMPRAVAIYKVLCERRPSVRHDEDPESTNEPAVGDGQENAGWKACDWLKAHSKKGKKK